MIVLIHGGPFSDAQWNAHLKTRNILLMQGFCLLIPNYRGSSGYGEDSMNSLLGNIGENDVEDCGELTLMTLK